MSEEYQKAREAMAKAIKQDCNPYIEDDECEYKDSCSMCRDLPDRILALPMIGVIASEQPERETYDTRDGWGYTFGTEDIQELGWRKLADKGE